MILPNCFSERCGSAYGVTFHALRKLSRRGNSSASMARFAIVTAQHVGNANSRMLMHAQRISFALAVPNVSVCGRMTMC